MVQFKISLVFWFVADFGLLIWELCSMNVGVLWRFSSSMLFCFLVNCGVFAVGFNGEKSRVSGFFELTFSDLLLLSFGDLSFLGFLGVEVSGCTRCSSILGF